MNEKNELHFSTFDILADGDTFKNQGIKSELSEKMLMENYVNVLDQPIEYKKELI